MRLYRNEIRRNTAYDEKKGFPVVTYYEIRYVDIDSDGLVTAIGYEEFTPERLKAATREKYLWTWDGKTYNKGGHRWFENCGLIRYKKNEAREIKQYFKNKYGAEAVELR